MDVHRTTAEINVPKIGGCVKDSTDLGGRATREICAEGFERSRGNDGKGVGSLLSDVNGAVNESKAERK